MIIKKYWILDTDVDFVCYKTYKNLEFFDKRLDFLPFGLDPQEAEVLDVEVDVMPSKDLVSIWTLKSFKKPVEMSFASVQEEDAFEEAYDRYYDKRWDEMPHIKFSISDWEYLQEKWFQVKNENPKVIVFELDDSGPLDKVDIYAKGELFQDDLDYIQQEHKKYLKYEKACRKYIQNHPDYSAVWRGPQDDEYEADIMKYYDED